METYMLALDQGTTSTRAMLVDRQGHIVSMVQEELKLHYPEPGWVEVDADVIWESAQTVIRKLLTDSGIDAARIAGLGITNQRETTVIWDRATGVAHSLCNCLAIAAIGGYLRPIESGGT